MLGASSASFVFALVLGSGHISGSGPPAPVAPGSPASTLPAATSPGATAYAPEGGAASENEAHLAPALGTPVDIERLGGMSGRDSTVDNDVTIDGTVDGNTADGIVSGSNVIGGGAFDNASGITTVVQNSGSNVLIQNGMVVNVQFVPPAP